MLFIADVHSRVPVYEQIKQQVMERVSSGVMPQGAQLPSIRELSRMLSVNVNTVKRAFDDLEHDGVIVSVQGRGSFVAENALGSGQLRRRCMEQAELAVRAARAGGIPREDFVQLVNEIYAALDPSGVPTIDEKEAT